MQYSNPFPRSYLNIRPKTNCGSNHDINTNVCKSHRANWQVVYQRQVPIRSLCPRDVGSKWLSPRRISIVCWLKGWNYYSAYRALWRVRSSESKKILRHPRLGLQSTRPGFSYSIFSAAMIWEFPAKFGKGIRDGSKQIHSISNIFQLGLSENDVPQNHCLGTNDHNWTLILSWKMMYPNLVLPQNYDHNYGRHDGNWYRYPGYPPFLGQNR